jgi:hypothetical protein
MIEKSRNPFKILFIDGCNSMQHCTIVNMEEFTADSSATLSNSLWININCITSTADTVSLNSLRIGKPA